MISEMLTEGKENAITGREICGLLGISGRELMAAVERERRAGAAICASMGENPGYYLAKNRSEMENYCGSLYRRGNNILKTRGACLATMKTLPE